jgi:hypothetical protein
MGIHREIVRGVSGFTPEDLSEFRKVWAVVDKRTGDDVELAIVIEVRRVWPQP